MTLIQVQSDRVQVGWPSVVGYVRAGALSILNLFGLKLLRIGKLWAVTVG